MRDHPSPLAHALVLFQCMHSFHWTIGTRLCGWVGIGCISGGLELTDCIYIPYMDSELTLLGINHFQEAVLVCDSLDKLSYCCVYKVGIPIRGEEEREEGKARQDI